MKVKPVRFDDSLPILVDVVRAQLGHVALLDGTVLRDAVGCLSFFAGHPLDQAAVDALSEALRSSLGAYARPDRVVAGSSDYGAMAVLSDASAFRVSVDGQMVRVVDRRLVGADWLRAPAATAPPPLRFVFASLKGGVGRTTALSVVAAHLASLGRRVLAIDLDLEAPGLGAMLLPGDTLPEFGMIDALVENGLSGLDAEFYADLVGPSELATRGGRIDVVPAFGRRSVKNPADVLGKIARAYGEDIRPDGTVSTFLDQVRAIVDHLADPERYDAILVDARAGLHETTASAVLGLGAEVLLFGLDEPQTFQGYAAMLSHLARVSPSAGELPEWATRVSMVQGKAPVDADARLDFARRCRELFADVGLGPSPALPHVDLEPLGFSDDVQWDDELPDEIVLPVEWMLPDPVAVLYDAAFQRFDPLNRRDLLSKSVYRTTFGELLDRIVPGLDHAAASPSAEEP